MLSLQEAFEIARNKISLYIDCKAINPESLVREILESGMERQVVVFDSYETPLRIRQLSEGRGLLLSIDPALRLALDILMEPLCR
jgi:hypothetical protein